MFLLPIVAAALFSPAAQGNRVTLIGMFYEHRYCRTWETDGYCPCGKDGTSPTYWLESPGGEKHRIILKADIVDQYFGPGPLFGKLLKVTGEEVAGEPNVVRMKSLEVLRREFVERSTDPAIHGLLRYMKPELDLANGQSTEVRKYLNVAVKFKESSAQDFPAPYYAEMMRSTYPGFDHWVRETSYGLVGISNQTYGWLTLPKSKESYYQDVEQEWDMTKIMADIVPMIDGQVDFNTIWGVNIFVNLNPPKAGGAYASWCHIVADGLDKWFPTTLEKPGAHSQSALGHEDGHNFGNDHSSGPYSNPYDSHWDVNSGGAFPVANGFGYGDAWIGIPYNAYHKRQLGWIPKERCYYAYPGTSNTVFIDRITQPSLSNSYLMAKVYIPGFATRYFTVESRKKVGYDVGVPGEGVIIHNCDELRKVTDDYGGPRYDRAAQVVDPDNNGNPNDAAAIWVPGEEYVDSSSGIRIQVVSSTPNGFNVKITVPASTWIPGQVQSTAGEGAFSLREALRYVQEFPAQPVTFKISTSDPNYASGVFKILLTEPLQDIVSNGVVLDGNTQTSFSGNTNPNGPEIYIDGSGIVDDQNQPRFAHGLAVKAADITVRGIGIGKFYASGIWAESSRCANLKVAGCTVGIHANGLTPAPNGWDGITFTDGVNHATIGGTTAPDRNLISCNGSGVVMSKLGTTANRLLGNFIGTDYSGSVAKRNTYDAIRIDGKAVGNDIGGLASGEGNVIVGTVTVRDGGSDGNRILGNLIGCNKAGSAGLNTPSGWGIALRYGVKNTIIRGNTVSGNSDVGIGVGESGTTNTQIMGNRIGTNLAGTGAVPNKKGIYIFGGASGTKIGSANPVDRNVLSGNSELALYIENSNSTALQGNFVGLNASGNGVVANEGWGIVQVGTSTGTLIGGPGQSLGNTISGNVGVGVGIRGGTATVQGNIFGLTSSGLAAGNQIAVHLDQGAHDCLIGGIGAYAPNTICSSREAGVVIRDIGTDRNIIHGNYIGVDRDLHSRPNASDGIWVFGGAKSNQIGGSAVGQGNILRSNGGNGIALYDSTTTGNKIRGNQISGNGHLAINLGAADGAYGVSNNDLGDGDNGPNNLQNFPELGHAERTANGTLVAGWLNSRPNRTYAIDVFVSDAVDDSGYGEGERFLGTVTVTADASGFASFNLNGTVATGTWVSATATDLTTGDTSEMGQAIALPNGVVGLSLNPTAVDNGVNSIGTVTIGASSFSNTVVALSSSKPAIAIVPTAVTVPAGDLSANFTVSTRAVTTNTSVVITASLNGIERSATLTVKATSALASLSASPTVIKGGLSATGTVTLTAPAAPGGLTVTLSEASPYVTVPSSVVVAAYTSSKSFTILTTNPPSNQVVTLKATLGLVSKTVTLSVTRQPKLTGLSLVPSTVVGGNSSAGKVFLDLAAPIGGQIVSLSDNSSMVSEPGSITIPSGATSASFTATTHEVLVMQVATITASANGLSKTATLTLMPVVYLASLTINPSTIKGGLTATGKVTLNRGAGASGATVSISDNFTSVGTPSSVYLAPGASSKTFAITTPHVSQTYVCTITALYAGVTKTATLTITP